jgi:nucleotide-binding universal stress UspA family protein
VRALREAGIDATAEVRAAPPAQAIVDVAREYNADLIVMASHQRHGVDRWLHGSVTEEVLVHASNPLLVVPNQTGRSTTQAMRVLVPLDGSAAGEAALDFIRDWALRRPVEVLLLRVVAVPQLGVAWNPTLLVPPLTGEQMEEEVRDAQLYLAKHAARLSEQGVHARREVIETAGSVARVILETAQREQVDSIALGTHGKHGVERLVLGSISEEVLEHALAPVLLVRSPTPRDTPPGDTSTRRLGGVIV